MTDRVDPFTIEIVQSALDAAAREMFVTLGRTAKSPIIYEVLDYACGIYSPAGELVAQDNGVTGFLGTLYFAVDEVRAKFGDDLREGDVFITNDPWRGNGSHLSDVSLVMPVFAGGRLVAFTVNKAHWTELGGAYPGSWNPAAREIFQEGLLFPCVRLFRQGRPDPTLVDLIRANVRTPEDTLGDMMAQAAALRIGARRVVELCRRYGEAALRAAMATRIERGRRAAMEALARLPRGTYRVEDLLENNMGGDPIPVHVTVRIDEDTFELDVSGNPPPVAAAVNGTAVGLRSQARTLFKMLTDPEGPPSEGNFAPVRVLAPEGTVFTAPKPAPVSVHWEYKSIVTDMVLRALAPFLPERIMAGHQLSVCASIISGRRPNGSYWLLVEPQLGGWGATYEHDGPSGLHPIGNGETYNMPVEVLETRYPVRIERYAFDTGDAAGAGRFRGGRGVIREYRVLNEGGAWLTAAFGRHARPPWGVAGGRDGSPNRIEVEHADGRRLLTGTVANYPLREGDLVRLVTATGGGWGDPRERDPERVADDVRNGYVDAEVAARAYGVPVPAGSSARPRGA